MFQPHRCCPGAYGFSIRFHACMVPRLVVLFPPLPKSETTGHAAIHGDGRETSQGAAVVAVFSSRWNGTLERKARAARAFRTALENAPRSDRLMNRNAERACLVGEVAGDAITGEGDKALWHEGEKFVVAAERRGPPMPGPVGLAHHLVDAPALGPLGGEELAAGSAPVNENHVRMLGLDLIEDGPHGLGVAGFLAPGDGDQGALGQVCLGFRVLAGSLEVTGVDGGGGETAAAAGVRSVARAPDLSGLRAIRIGCCVAQLLEGVAAVAEVARSWPRNSARSADASRPLRFCTMAETKLQILGQQNAFSFDWGSKPCSSFGLSWTKKITSGAMPLAAAQASQSCTSTLISRWTKREASGVGMRWTTPRSDSRLPQAISEASSGSSYSPTLRSSTSW